MLTLLSNLVCIYDSVIFENLSTLSSGTLTYKWTMGSEGTSTLKNPDGIFHSWFLPSADDCRFGI
jgi:hypothetical protein